MRKPRDFNISKISPGKKTIYLIGWVYYTGVRLESDFTHTLDTSEMRRLSAWLLKSAEYLESKDKK